MTRRRQFALGLAATYASLAGLAALWGAGVWAGLAEQERIRLAEIAIAHAADAVTIAVLVLIALGIALQLFQRYVSPLQRMSEEARLILDGNTSHRLTATGARELRELAAAVHQATDRHAALKEDVKIRVDTATANLQEERNRLATLMSELAQSVLVCNLEGRILLYNTRASQLLDTAVERPRNVAAGSEVGLGRSLFAIFDRHHIAHAQCRIYGMLQHATDEEERRAARICSVLVGAPPSPSASWRRARTSRTSWPLRSQWRPQQISR